MRLGQDSAEQIRRHEVSRALKKVDLSPEEEEVIERMIRSLADKILHGPISKAMACAEVELSFGGRRGLDTSYGLERHVGGAKSPGSRTDHQIGQNGKPYITGEFGIWSD